MTLALTHSFSSLYDMHGRTSSLLHSEQAQRVMVPSENSDHQAPETGPVEDQVTLSARGLEASRAGRERTASAQGQAPEGQEKRTGDQNELTPEEEKALAELQARDREVRAHEQAHLANAGRYAAGGASYTWQTGPDGKRYAVGGEVPIDLSEEQDPEQTIQKMRMVRRAALAPAEPSAADRNIAATASQKEARARQEMQSEQRSGDGPTTEKDSGQEAGGVMGPVLAGQADSRQQPSISVMA